MGALKSKQKANIDETSHKQKKEAKTEKSGDNKVTLKGIKHLQDHPEFKENVSVSKNLFFWLISQKRYAKTQLLA